MEEITFAFRDERINIFAMTHGGLPTNYSYQIMLCKKNQLPENRKGPFLLDCKRSAPVHEFSNIGRQYYKKVEKEKFDLRYVAYIESEIRIKITEELFIMLTEKGFFSVWSQGAPYIYYEGATEGNIVLFRVYEIEKPIDESNLSQGRSGRNFYYRLNTPAMVELIKPVISDDNYYLMKGDLVSILKEFNWLMKENTFVTPAISMPRVSEEQIEKAEEKAFKENLSLTLEELEIKINSKANIKKVINVESNRFYRDPDIVSYAIKRAAGICECCSKIAPFTKLDGKTYLETHHLTPLSEGGEDSVKNVCAVCPNCHRELHYGAKKVLLRDKIVVK